MSYETRVWCENGDLLGHAEVTDNWVVEVHDADPDSGYAWSDTPHESRDSAERYAREWAQGYLEWLEEHCECWQDDEHWGAHGMFSDHGYTIQWCRDGFNTDYYG